MAAANPKKYLDQLFISKVRIKALKHFFMHQDEAIHLRAAVREFDEEINAVRRELERMEAVDLLITERKGNRKYFRLNKDFTFFEELLGMVYKTFGLGGEIISKAEKLGNIKFAMLTQGFTHGKHVGSHAMDLVVVGEDMDVKELDALVNKEEKRIGKDIHYTVLTSLDLQTRKRRRDAFIQELMQQDKVMLIGRAVDFMD